MSDGLSSDEAEDYGGAVHEKGIPSPEDYDTLEQYIKSTKRDPDSETKKSIRLFEWQKTLIDMISIEEDTNMTEVGARAYPMGLSILRENHREDTDEIAIMLKDFMFVYTNDESNEMVTERVDSDIHSKEIDQPYGDGDDITQPEPFKVEPSYLREAETDYADRSFMKGWIHRHIMSLGLSKSENKGSVHQNKISSYSAAFSEAIDELRESIEATIKDYVLLSRESWRQNGLDPEIYEGLFGLVDSMETDNKEVVEAELADAEKFVDKEDE